MTFALERQSAKLVHVAYRRERHGDKWQPAVTLKFRVTDSSVVLDRIDPQVRAGLFRNDVIAAQKTIDGDRPGSVPRSEFIKQVPLSYKMRGAAVTLHWGASGASDVELNRCTVDSFELDVIAGGSAPLEFMVKAPLDVVECASIMTLWLDEDISISVEPGDAAQQDLPGTRDAGTNDSEGEVD